MLTVYGRATLSNVQLVMWGIAELGLPCDRLDYGHVHGGLQTPEFGAMNPHRHVPTLRDGDLVVWESAAILRYLAAEYGGGGAFWPAEPRDRAPVDRWAEWGKNELAQSFTVPIFWSRVRTPAARRDRAAQDRAVAHFDGLLATLGAQLSGRAFVCGDALSAADITIGHLLYRWFTIDIPRTPNPAVEAYFGRLSGRSAYREHVMVDCTVLQDREA